MRIFTAIPLPIDVQDRFANISRGKLPVPYVNTSKFHITLNFLGELETDQVKEVVEFWNHGLPEIKKIRIGFDKLVKFRQQIHMTVKENEVLKQLQAMLTDKFLSMGYRPTYPKYYAHVTITNLHMDKVMNRERKIESFPHEELRQLSFDADRIVLYESKLLLHHTKYIELSEHKLK
jgi:2'-5' RNA ligase